MFGRKKPEPAPRIAPVIVERTTSIPSVPRRPAGKVRGWSAANSDRLAGGFGLSSTSFREELRRDIRGLVNHARHAAKNFDAARAYEMLVRRHVIGPDGVRLQMDVRDPGGQRDMAANALIEAAWSRWGRFGTATPCGRLSWWGVECVVSTAMAREGAALLRLHRGRRFGPFGFQVEPIPFDLLDIDLTRPLQGGGFIETGIECDEFGKPVAFHLWSAPLDAGHLGRSRRRVRVPASDMVLAVVPEEVAQLLGTPRAATALRMMNLSERFQKSAMTAANYGAAQMVFFEQEGTGSPLAPAASAADDEDVDRIEAGTTAYLPPGVKAVPHVPHYPEAQVEPFLRTLSTSMAAGMGLSHETLSGDLSRANFSSLRAGKGEERDEWRMLQRAVYEALHGPVFSAWLPMAILSGSVRLPMDKTDKFDAATWRPRGWPSVNPKEDAGANQIELALGLKSRTEIAAARGRDFADVIAERAAEEKALRDAGLDASTPAIPGASPPTSPQTEVEQ